MRNGTQHVASHCPASDKATALHSAMQLVAGRNVRVAVKPYQGFIGRMTCVSREVFYTPVECTGCCCCVRDDWL